jgi:type IV pilus assembly protein PilC
MVGKMIRFYPLEEACKTMKAELSRGTALHETMRNFNVFDRRTVSLVKVAEEVNQLDVMFAKLAKQNSDEVEHRTGMMGSVIEPIMIVFIALFVGLILIAMYLPMFELSTAIG